MNAETTPGGELPAHAGARSSRLRELASLFLKLGTISFGGPAAHIAMMETEVVRKREWLTKQQFLDLLGAANLIPGPTSTEMAISVGFVRAGWAGLCVAGASFILPAAIITGGFAWAYVRFGSLTQAVSALAGIKAAVIAVIAIAIWRLGQTAVKDLGLAVLGATALAAFFLGVSPLVILFGGGLLGMLSRRSASLRSAGTVLVSPLFPKPRFEVVGAGKNWAAYISGFGAAAVTSASAGAVVVRPSAYRIGLFFLKLGAVLYGGGYVLLAFLEQTAVYNSYNFYVGDYGAMTPGLPMMNFTVMGTQINAYLCPSDPNPGNSGQLGAIGDLTVTGTRVELGDVASTGNVAEYAT